MMERRRSRRVGYKNKALIQVDNVMIMEVKVLNISTDGAYFELADHCVFQKGDKWRLRFKLPYADGILEFKTEVIHSEDRLVGVMFVDLEMDDRIRLGRLIEKRNLRVGEGENGVPLPC
jgi:PilZ domain